MSGIVYEDDNLVAEINAQKWVHDRGVERLKVTVEEVAF